LNRFSLQKYAYAEENLKERKGSAGTLKPKMSEISTVQSYR
jgi:hypothetical protein